MRFLLVIFSFIVFLPIAAQSPERLYEKAYKLFHKGDLAKSMVCLDQALRLNAHLAKAYELKAKIFEKKGIEDSATTYLYKYACVHQLDYQMWQTLAVRFFNANQFEKAEECVDKAIQMHGNATLYNYRGVIQMQKKQHEEALLSFRKAFELDSSRETIIYNVGYAYVMLDSLTEAERHFVIALKMNSQFGLPYLGLAIVNYMNKDYHKTIECCNLALRSGAGEESNCELYHYRALSYQQTGQLVRACLDYFKLKSLRCDEKYYKELGNLCLSD